MCFTALMGVFEVQTCVGSWFCVDVRCDGMRGNGRFEIFGDFCLTASDFFWVDGNFCDEI